MLAKKNRLNLHLSENNQMFKDGFNQRLVENNLIFFYRPNKSRLRVAAIAPSRLFPKAHQRNNHRRLIYNLINQQIKQIEKTYKKDLLQEKADLIIVYKNQDFKEKELERDLISFLNKILVKKNETL